MSDQQDYCWDIGKEWSANYFNHFYEKIKHLFVSSKYWKRYRLTIEILSLERVFAKREAQ
jgi:hypothetical protein